MLAMVFPELEAVCARHILDEGCAVVREPYLPYVPEDWNGVLVLAEAQNLSRTNDEYVQQLRSWDEAGRVRRLYRGEHALGIGPWDDGTLKIAIEAALVATAATTAVSNAVVWSLVTERGANENPNIDLISRSILFWSDILVHLRPERVVAAGAKARDVIRGALKNSGLKSTACEWPLPSPRIWQPLSGVVNEADLRRRFPEVSRVLERQPAWFESSRKSKLLYACLAVSAAALNGGGATEPRPTEDML